MAAEAQAPPAPRERIGQGTRKKLVPYGLLAPGGIWMAVFFVVPVFFMFYTSLQSGGLFTDSTFTWQWSNYTDALSSHSTQYLRAIQYAAIATGIAIVLAYPMTYWIAFYGGRRKTFYLLLILLPFFVSFIIRTVQWKFILGDNGFIFQPLKDLGLLPGTFRVLASPTAVIAGMTYNFLPFTALPLFVSLDRIDKRLVEAAKDLFANRRTAFTKVVFPLSIPGVFAAVLLTFVPMAGDYVNASLLGGPGTTMIGNVIQTKFLTEADYPAAAALSIILMLGMLILTTIYARILGTEDATAAAARV